jgi:hypothetical protein
MTARVSMHQNHLILQSLEEDLRYCETGWERDNIHFDPSSKMKQRFSTSDAKHKGKHVEWIDCIRGFVRLRTCTIPRIMNLAKKVFPLNYSQSIFIPASPTFQSNAGSIFPDAGSSSPNLVSSASNANSSGSLLNRLFAFDTSPDPAATIAATSNASHGGGTTSTSIGSPNKVATSSAIAGSSSQSLSINLSEKIMSTITQSVSSADKNHNYNLAIQWYFTDTAAGSLLLPMLKDIIGREVENADKYIAFRVKSLQSILNAGYSHLVHRELSNGVTTGMQAMIEDITLPVHLSRIILAIHDEKLLLCSTIRDIHIETGGGREEYGTLAKLMNNIIKNNEHSDGEEEENDKNGGDDENDEDILAIASSNDKDSGSPSACANGVATVHAVHVTTMMSLQGQQGPRYKHYLYQELCKGCIVMYEDLMKRLASGQYAIPNNASVLIPTKTLAQAWEEWEYLKVYPIIISLVIR